MSKQPFRIPQDIIDDLVARTDIVSTIGHFLKLKKQGKDFTALCPFHDERSPSFSVSSVKQFYYCFGCGAGGNALNFQMEFLGRSFISVVQDMAEDNGVDLTPYLKFAQQDNLELKLAPAMSKACHYFSTTLQQSGPHSEAARYLKERNISAEATARFELGYAGAGRDVVQALDDITDEMVLAGVLEQGDRGLFSQFRDRLIMPLRDIRGKYIGVTGRTLAEDIKPKYKNSKETALFSRNSSLYGLFEALEDSPTERIAHLCVVEGQMDVIASWMIQQPACAAMGSSISQQQLRLLTRYVDHVTFLFDGDQAGLKAMQQVGALLLSNLTHHDTQFDVVILPSGEDPHSLITRNTPVFLELLDRPEHWMDALLKYLPEAQDLTSDKGKAEFARHCIELVQDTRDPVLRYQLIEKTALMSCIPVDTLNESVAALPVGRAKAYKKRSNQDVLDDTSVRLVRMLWDEPALAKYVEHPVLWTEEGDGVISLLGGWAAQLARGDFDSHYSDKEMQSMSEQPEKLDVLHEQSRLRVAAAALGRLLNEASIPGLMSEIMKEVPEEGTSLAASHCLHITGLLAAKAMQDISNKARMNLMTDEDRAQFTQLLDIRRQCAMRLKGE